MELNAPDTKLHELVSEYQRNKALVDSWHTRPAALQPPDSYLALGRLQKAKAELQERAGSVEAALTQVSAWTEAYPAGRRYAADQAADIDFSKPPTLYRREEFERGVRDYQKEHSMPEERSLAQSATEAPDLSAKPVPLDREWFDRASWTIRESQSRENVPIHELARVEAYWSGQRDLYNSVHQAAIKADPSLEKELPPAIQIDEIRVRQRVFEQEQEPDRSLVLAR